MLKYLFILNSVFKLKFCCKNSNCKCIHLLFLQVWKRWVGNNDEAGKNRLSLLVKTLMLRRTKAELCQLTSFNLPKKYFRIFNIELFKEEKEAYEKVLLFSRFVYTFYVTAIFIKFLVKLRIYLYKKNKLNQNLFCS